MSPAGASARRATADPAPVSLRHRLLLYLLICAPLVWSAALLVSVERARHEVNELFDTEIIRLAGQVQSILAESGGGMDAPAPKASGEADLRELAVAVWDRQGQLLRADREGVRLPRLTDASGFVDLQLGGQPWRVFYLQAPQGDWLVAAGQQGSERDELVWDLVTSQLLPWLLVLPVLLLAMTWAVRRALKPVALLTDELHARDAGDLRPVPASHAPRELQPMLAAMNGLLGRIGAALERERRFTADAAHELRTPLAVLRAQWDVHKRAGGEAERARAAAALDAGMDRMDRLVTQMLALSRLDATDRLVQATPLHWPPIVEQAISDVLPLAERRHIEIACDWPPGAEPPLPLRGDAALMAVLLRNLLDNAVRYAPPHSTVTLRFERARLAIDNDAAPLADETLARLGERFHREPGAAGGGSGLGVSIARRVAALHGLELGFRRRAGGRGLVAELQAGPAPTAALSSP